MYVWPAVRAKVDDGGRLADPALGQEQEGEETEVWPRLRAALTEKEIELMADQYQMSKQAAPTRPHPGKLESPEKLRTGGPWLPPWTAPAMR
jgi:hypothetical protein